MFGIGMPEMIVILIIALIVIGPQKLPELAKSLGKGLAEFKKATNDFQRNIEEESLKVEEKEQASQHAPASGTEPAATVSKSTSAVSGEKTEGNHHS